MVLWASIHKTQSRSSLFSIAIDYSKSCPTRENLIQSALTLVFGKVTPSHKEETAIGMHSFGARHPWAHFGPIGQAFDRQVIAAFTLLFRVLLWISEIKNVMYIVSFDLKRL